MTCDETLTPGEARRARLGPAAVAAAQRIADEAPPWGPEKCAALAAVIQQYSLTPTGGAVHPDPIV